MVSAVEYEIRNSIDEYKNFIVEAGAGSGKTWSLVQALSYIIENKANIYERENKKVVCITYTNIAKDEIIHRIKSNQIVQVNTIHEFLWSVIKPFQAEIRSELINYYERKNEKPDKNYDDYSSIIQQLKEYRPSIKYQEYKVHKDGIITHGDVLWIFSAMLSKYKILKKIIEDSFPIIFIDEYQDSDTNIIDSLLTTFSTSEKIVFGFFGDHYQKIYDNSIGRVNTNKYNLKSIKKNENYRCSTEVINILNKLRNDIKQVAMGEEKKGKCMFYYLPNFNEIEDGFKRRIKSDFVGLEIYDFQKLYLVNKKIATVNNYLNLYQLYNSNKRYSDKYKKKEYILKNSANRDCDYANLLYEIHNLIKLFRDDRAQDLMKKVALNVTNKRDLDEIYSKLKNLVELRKNATIGEVFEDVITNKIIKVKQDTVKEIQEETEEFIRMLKDIKYQEFENLYNTLQNDSMISTQHGTKGAEFDNVLCFIDDGEWRNYSLEDYLINNSDMRKKRIIERTRNLFYVVCSRAKHNLVIVCKSSLSLSAQIRIRDIFGDSNFITSESLESIYTREEILN
ncbi:ATP-dependent helicase [Bacillus cereus]|nr:ATP-dependent helicase [Bacillus cereus]